MQMIFKVLLPLIVAYMPCADLVHFMAYREDDAILLLWADDVDLQLIQSEKA